MRRDLRTGRIGRGLLTRDRRAMRRTPRASATFVRTTALDHAVARFPELHLRVTAVEPMNRRQVGSHSRLALTRTWVTGSAGGANNRRRRESDSGQNAEPTPSAKTKPGLSAMALNQQTSATRFAAPSFFVCGTGAHGRPRLCRACCANADLKVGTTLAQEAESAAIRRRAPRAAVDVAFLCGTAITADAGRHAPLPKPLPAR